MKKYLFIAAAALTMLAGCNKFSFTPDENNQVIDDNAPVAVMLSAATNTVDVKTKAAVESWADTPIFVYAFDRTLESLETPTEGNAVSPLFINNVQATVASDGKVALWKTAPTTGESSTPGVPFYYVENEVYDFYGYYLGTKLVNKIETPIQPAQDDITISGKTISFPVTITGAEDIMIAKADPKKDVAKSNKSDLNITNYNQYVYGSVAARRNVQPNLAFEHVLTRFSFYIKDGAGDATASGRKVTAIKTTEAVNSATLTVVGEERGISIPTENQTSATLAVAIAEGGVASAAYSATGEEAWANAGDLMLFDEDKTSMTFTFTIQETDQSTADVNVVVNCPDGGSFEAGKKYKVSVRIYGKEEVTATATITPWDDEEVPEIDSNTLPVQNFTLIDGSKLSYDGTTLKTGAADAENLEAVISDNTFYTTNGFIFTYSTTPEVKVTIAEAQKYNVTMDNTVFEAYHYVATADVPKVGDYVYITTGNSKSVTFTLEYNETTYTVTTDDNYAITNVV